VVHWLKTALLQQRVTAVAVKPETRAVMAVHGALRVLAEPVKEVFMAQVVLAVRQAWQCRVTVTLLGLQPELDTDHWRDNGRTRNKRKHLLRVPNTALRSKRFGARVNSSGNGKSS
jgi:hypothetical protein